jgi:hypothetical protein
MGRGGGRLVTIGALAIPALRHGVAPEPVVTQLELSTPPTTDPLSFVFSPDGRQIVFVAVGERGSQLWLRPLGQTNARPLAGTEGASAPFWAPDGHDLGFFADAKLKRIDLTGGRRKYSSTRPSGAAGRGIATTSSSMARGQVQG